MKTMRDIADELGVSIATVSYVYNNKWQEKRINKELAERIMKKLKEEDYSPNILALQLMTQKTESIGIILGDLTRIFNLNILCGIEKVLSRREYLSIVCSSGLGPKEKKYLKTLQLKKVEGIIFAPHSNGEDILRFLKAYHTKIPVVLVDNYIPGLNTDFVVSDNYFGAYNAVKYLIKMGRRKIAYAGAKKNLSALMDRFKGYKRAMKEEGIEIKSSLICNLEDDNFYMPLSGIFSRERPDAIFVESLLYFKSGFRFFYEKGIKIPDDILLTGFDPVDLSLSEMAEIGFHSVVKGNIPFVEQKGEEMGERAAEILVNKIENPDKEPEQVFIKPELKYFR